MHVQLPDWELETLGKLKPIIGELDRSQSDMRRGILTDGANWRCHWSCDEWSLVRRVVVEYVPHARFVCKHNMAISIPCMQFRTYFSGAIQYVVSRALAFCPTNIGTATSLLPEGILSEEIDHLPAFSRHVML